MRSRVTLLIVVFCLAACSEATSTTSTTTTTSAATSTSRAGQTLVPGGLIPVDPPTLVPYENATPVLVGDSHHGVVSSNGEWAAVATTRDTGGEVSILDTEDLTVVAQAVGTGEEMAVGNDGLTVWFEEGRLFSLNPGDGIRGQLDLPGPVPSALQGSLTIFDDGRLAYAMGPEDEVGPVVLVVADGDTRSEISVEEIVTGPITDNGLPAPESLAPAIAWDQQGNEAILVSGSANEIVVVDLETGERTIHGFDGDPVPDWGVGRDIFLSPDGSTLLVATRVLEVEGTTADWAAHEYAADLVVVDTTTWTSTKTTQSIWELTADGDRSRVAGTGASTTWGEDEPEQTLQSPIYLIDGNDGTVLVGFEGRSGTVVDTQFSADGAEMYVVSESEEGTNIDIVDVATQGLAGSLGFARISLVGPAGLIAFHLD